MPLSVNGKAGNRFWGHVGGGSIVVLDNESSLCLTVLGQVSDQHTWVMDTCTVIGTNNKYFIQELLYYEFFREYSHQYLYMRIL